MIRLIEYVCDMPPEELAHLSLQDIGVCKIWHEQKKSGDTQNATGNDIPRSVDAWISSAGAPDLETEGRRHQTLLRELVDCLIDGRIGSLARDELDLLNEVYMLARRAAHSAAFERAADLIKPHVLTIKRRRNMVDFVPGLPTLSQKLKIVNSQDLKEARHREIKTLAGVVLPSRGPVLTHRGHVRVLGDILENCTIVVEEGHCVVDGFVLGRVAVSGHCEVRENISGVVIVRDGDIRARNIVDKSTVISKRGGIFCRRAQNPTIVFGGQRIWIREDTVEGCYMSPAIEVEHHATGGVFHVTDSLKAKRFERSRGNQLSVVYRHTLSCKDYGEEPDREMGRDVSRAKRLQRELQYSKDIIQLAGREAEQFGVTALMHLLGGADAKKLLEATVIAQRRLDVLNRIVLGLHTVYSHTESRLDPAQEADDADQAEDDSGEANVQERLKELSSAVAQMKNEGPVDGELMEEQANLDVLRADLGTGRRDRRVLSHMLTDMAERLSRWSRESDELKKKIATNERTLQDMIGLKKLLTQNGKEVPKVVALRQVMAAAKAGKMNPLIADRIESPFMRIMLNNIRLRITTAQKHRQKAQEIRADCDSAIAHVWDEYHIRIREEEAVLSGAHVKGSFQSGVHLYTDPGQLLGNEGGDDGRYLVTPEHADPGVTYICRSSGIVQEKA